MKLICAKNQDEILWSYDLNIFFSCPNHEVIVLHELWRPRSWQLPTSGQGSHAMNYGNQRQQQGQIRGSWRVSMSQYDPKWETYWSSVRVSTIIWRQKFVTVDSLIHKVTSQELGDCPTCWEWPVGQIATLHSATNNCRNPQRADWWSKKMQTI